MYMDGDNNFINDEMLLTLIQQHSHIYDKTEPNFKNKAAKDRSWLVISSLLDTPAEECKKRFLLLRCRYVKQKKKDETQHARGEPVLQWPLTPLMGFLDKFIIPRHNRSSYTNKSEWVTVQPPTMKNDVADPLEIDEDSFHTYSLSPPITSDFNTQEPTNKNQIRDKSKNIDDQINAVQTIEKVDTCMQKQTDYNSNIGEAIACTLRKIKSNKKRMQAQADIFKLLSTYFSSDDED